MAASLIALDKELIIIPLGAIGNIQQDRGVADGLLKARHMDINGAACQVVARRSTPYPLIHLWATIPAVDDQHLSMGTVPIVRQRVIAVPQILQPILTEILQVLYCYPTWDVTILCLTTRLCQLPERKVLT